MKPIPFEEGAKASWNELRQRLQAPHVLVRELELHAIRHGETVTNARGVVSGTQDVPLTDRGRRQATDLGRQLASSYDGAFCSALTRSQETLELASGNGGTHFKHTFWDARLNERSMGELELKPSRPLAAYAEGDLSFAPPGGDSYLEITRRVLSFLLDLSAWGNGVGASRVLLSAHRGSLRILAGVIEEQGDPIGLLARNFDNAELLTWRWSRLVWPRFLRTTSS
jgi:broad specificity phosphatase PhoE